MLTMETARACGYKEMGKYDLAVEIGRAHV